MTIRGAVWTVALSAVVWLLCAVLAINAVHAEDVYNATDAALAISQAADTYGVPESRLWRVARCEAPGIEPGTLDPYAVGDSGHSFGLFQLNDRSTGLLAHFHSLGYGSAFDPYEAAEYFARVLSGEFAAQGITWQRWSCR